MVSTCFLQEFLQKSGEKFTKNDQKMQPPRARKCDRGGENLSTRGREGATRGAQQPLPVATAPAREPHFHKKRARRGGGNEISTTKNLKMRGGRKCDRGVKK